MFAGLLGSVLDSVIKYAFSFVSNLMDKRNLTVQGMQQQAGKETAATAQTETNVAQALSDAPHTVIETEKALDSGKF